MGFIPTLVTTEIAQGAGKFRLSGRKKIAVVGKMMEEVTTS